MSEQLDRRGFLARAWKWGVGLIGAAGLWTSVDVLRPPEASAGLGIVPTLPLDEIPDDDVVEIVQARAFLTRIGNEVVALNWRCPHLRCRVPWCDSSGQFECPCHGSEFNRIGEVRSGPSPRGMDRHPTRVVGGLVFVDTDEIIKGSARGTAETIDEPRRGPSCGEEG